ncbi:DNA repair protein XRCC1-like isoform X2 [Halichondria panicea]|uniref:DNA repair protein XRCC1-like isoform X2 n=1 Tax=Halichondria panicea TaxID=6063 RepID=UPI00312B709B
MSRSLPKRMVSTTTKSRRDKIYSKALLKVHSSMPIIKIQHIHSVSSEDPSHPADNLLNPDTYRKWKCASAGEKKAIVVLQLEKSSLIHSVDIGNEGSAFVEVLLGRSSTPDLFEVLVGMSTLMTPIESKQWSNTNRVRMFGKEKLAKPVAEQKWDRVKIVCTQPFNKKEPYGLSFLKLHSPPDSEATPPAKLGAFSLKEETKDLPTGSLFFKKEPSTHSSSSSPGGLSMAAKARAATTEALKGNESDPPIRKPSSKGRATASSSRKRAAESAVEHKPVKKARISDDSTEPSSSKAVPFKQIMTGIVFTLSGFKNPFRGDLRGKATDMGATFQSDWTDSCTHLVCAFPNTPKFNQVKAKGGLIVSKAWITDSHIKKRRLPAKKYRLSGGDSEDEEYDKKEEAIFGAPGGVANTKPDSTDSVEEMEVDEPKSGPVTDTDDMYGGSTDEDTDTEVKLKQLNDSSECDTEDEIERARERKPKMTKVTIEDPYGGSTDEEETTTGTKAPTLSDLTKLPDLFSKCTFLLYGNCSLSDRHLITRYITAYNGRIESYMSGNVSHVISLEDWDNHFDQALSENSKLVFVKPQWIFVCHQKQTCVPYQPYIIVPK